MNTFNIVNLLSSNWRGKFRQYSNKFSIIWIPSKIINLYEIKLSFSVIINLLRRYWTLSHFPFSLVNNNSPLVYLACVFIYTKQIFNWQHTAIGVWFKHTYDIIKAICNSRRANTYLITNNFNKNERRHFICLSFAAILDCTSAINAILRQNRKTYR